MSTDNRQSESVARDDSLELSIVMPCLNEAETIALCIEKAKRFLAESGIRGDVIIADNGSRDNSRDLAEASGVNVVSVKERGYGAALMGGIRASRARFVVIGDADDSYDFSALGLFVEQLRNGYQLVMGNRFKGGIRPGAMPFLHKYLGNPVLSGIGKLFFKAPIGDFHCGLRGFDRQAILQLDLQTTGMEFASEMVVKANLHGLQITEVPTILYKDGWRRPPHLNTWSDGWRHLRFLLMYSPRWLFLYPGLVLIFLGLLGTGLLIPGPIKLGAVTFDIHTLLLSATALLLGIQAITFGILAQQFAITARLLPREASTISHYDKFSLEHFLAVGVLMMLMGAAGVVYTVYLWGITDFGELIASDMMRLLVPSVTLLSVGFHMIFASFFKGILDLKALAGEEISQSTLDE